MKQKTTVNIRETGKKDHQAGICRHWSLEQFINDDFEQTVELIARCQGRVVVTGIGKSAIISPKDSSNPQFHRYTCFIYARCRRHPWRSGDDHPGRCGDVHLQKRGIAGDKSTGSPGKNLGNTLVAIVGKVDSYLSQSAHFVLNTSVTQEACPNNLAPTSSTTAQMVMGDALAVCLIEMKGFTAEDFAKFHPGGTLGKKLYLKVGRPQPSSPGAESEAGKHPPRSDRGNILQNAGRYRRGGRGRPPSGHYYGRRPAADAGKRTWTRPG